jgi:hypothetical protein
MDSPIIKLNDIPRTQAHAVMWQLASFHVAHTNKLVLKVGVHIERLTMSDGLALNLQCNSKGKTKWCLSILSTALVLNEYVLPSSILHALGGFLARAIVLAN